MMRLLVSLLALVVACSIVAATEPTFTLQKNDHICIIGNTLAERMQHDGYLETMLHERFPEHKFVIRNLGFSGDTITTRLRSMNFGTPDEWLGASGAIPQPDKLSPAADVPANRFETVGTRTDVIFAFFGYNESFADDAGLPAFEQELRDHLAHLLSQKYNGKSAPRIVLFSPIAFQNKNSPHLPDGAAINPRLQRYTAAMQKIAAEQGVRFVDLFTPTHTTKIDTLNGIHLTDAGNEQLAQIIEHELFGAPPASASEHRAAIRKAVLDKNHYWWNRYRAVDGYSTFGERAFLKFTEGQTNYEVVQRELQVIDRMVANRDVSIWAASRGETASPVDDNLPPFVPVVTNKPGTGPDGTHVLLGGEDAIKSMKLGAGLQINLFADEAQFPDFVNPVQMQFDTRGRLWVAVWPTYPHWKPTEPMNDKILILEDTTGDGKADTCTTFTDGLHNPTGFEFVPGGVLVAQCPDLVLLRDTTGDGKADTRTRVLHGLDTADTHHAANSFTTDPGGAVYFQEGTFHHSQVESPFGPVRRNVNAGVYRYEPRTQKFDVSVTFGFANPHGHGFDKWGQNIVIDGTGANPYHATLFNGYLPFPLKHARPPQVYQQRTRPCGGLEFLSSSAFPDDFRGNLIVTNVIGFQGLLRYKITDAGSTLAGTELEPIVSSTDPNFRPVDCKTGPDGALYFIDWQNPIIGHMQHNLRDPSRDRTHGRVYRITHAGKTVASPKIAGEPIPTLLELLKHPDDRVRSRVRLELAERQSAEVLAALKAWVSALPAEGEAAEHARLEALWLTQSHNVPDLDLLARVLASPDFRARAAAVRVLTEWRDRVPDALATLRTLAADPAPRVRLEAVRAASHFNQPEVIEVVLIARQQPTDPALVHVIEASLRTLNPLVADAVKSGRQIAFATEAGAAFVLKTLSTPDLVKLEMQPPVAAEILTRSGVQDEPRRAAAEVLANARSQPVWRIVSEALTAQDRADADNSLTYDLARLLVGRPDELPAARPVLESLAKTATSNTLRQLALGALVAADGSPDAAWTFSRSTPGGVRDFAAAVPAFRDPNHRAASYPLMLSLLTQPAPATPPVRGRYLRLELPGKMRTITLAEVEIFSDGVNVALRKPCRQSSTAHGGVATRAVDGNKSGAYADNGQSHTREGEENPWWEVDLGQTVPIDTLLVYNRTDSNLNARLSNFTVVVLDAERKPVFKKPNNPSPDVVAQVIVGGEDLARTARAHAMLALVSVRGQEAETVRTLVPLLQTDERTAAVTALLRVPVSDWPADLAPTTLEALTTFLAAVPANEKTAPAALDALQLADTVTALLPRDQAKAARQALGDIGVRVVRIGTLTDQMLYDQDRIAVQAGKPVEFVFANTDLMPHNLVFTQMGALEEVGIAAEAFGSTPGAQEKQFVPPSEKVLLASRLLQPGETQTLRFTAPTEPGVYPYVCTYPGHWRRMYGALYVVADLDDYRADPAGYVQTANLPLRDELLKLNRPRTEWTLAELSPALAELDAGGRSHAHGKRLFTVTTCASCHQFDGQGQNFGPDLANLDKTVFKSPTDLLQHVLEPSLRIEDHYRTYTFSTIDGNTMTGMVLEKTASGDYKVIENPLARAEARLIKKEDLDDAPTPLPTSMMPKGLLDKLTKDEILDLIAYIAAGADAKHLYFHGVGHDHHKPAHTGHKH